MNLVFLSPFRGTAFELILWLQWLIAFDRLMFEQVAFFGMCALRWFSTCVPCTTGWLADWYRRQLCRHDSGESVRVPIGHM